jgi:hypothetical protein
MEEKCDTNLNIRINKGLKEKFIAIVEDKDISYSKIIRKFITNYIEANK